MKIPELGKSILAILLLLSVYSLGYAQKPVPRVVTGDDFLGRYMPDKVYDIEIDAKGFVYFVYPGGLWVFNGNETKSEWKQENPYDPNIYFELHKGYNDQILLSGPFGVAYVKGDSLVKFAIPDSLIQFGKRGYESVYTDEAGLLHIAPRYKGYYTVDSLGNVEEIVGQSSGIHGFVATQLSDGKSLTYSIIPTGDTNDPFSLYSSLSDSTLNHISEIERPGYVSTLVQYKDGSYIFSNGQNDLVHFDKNGLIKADKFDHKVIKLFIDSKDNLWIGTVSKGFFKARSSDFEVIENYLYGSSAVLAESFDNGLWLKSHVEKFGYLSPLNVSNYSDQNGYPQMMDITEVDLMDDQFIISNTRHQIFLINGDKITELPPPGTNQNQKIPPQFRFPGYFCFDKKKNELWITYYGKLLCWNGTNWKVLKIDKSEFNSPLVLDLKSLPDGRIIGVTQNEMFELKNGEINRISEHIHSYIQHFTVDDSGKFWIGTNSGIKTLEGRKFIDPFASMPKEILTPSQFIAYSQGAVWYQPSLDGMYVILQDSIFPVFDQYGKRIQLYTCSVSPNGNLWGVMRKGGKLCQIEMKNDSIKFRYYVIDDLASMHKKHGFLATNEEIILGGRHGLFRQRIDDLSNEEITSKVEFTEIRINHEVVPTTDSYNLSYQKNYLNITFDGISFRRIPLDYSYQMLGLDTVWRETKHKHVQYTNLPPGKYEFKLRVKAGNSDWTRPKTVTFEIGKPFWQKWWFWIICAFSFISLSTIGIQWRINAVRNKESEKGKIALELSRLELRALKAQMNPHFIFNTLKSIQNRILKDGKWEANDLLVRFSKLIRAALEYSRVDFIHLIEEIEFIGNYLEIEKQRISDRFDFEIKMKEMEEMKDLLVPSLLIQPICENAINHAFEEGKGMLTIRLEMIAQDLIEVNISDDGIGYFNEKKLHSHSNNSRGLEIVQSRLELFKSQGYDASIQIDPLDKTTKKGTMVTLKIPCK